ncbi:MAG: hypothetical protein HY518_02265 [Candidatus Aenigmarchaeota archaeon]|nr:hypothetical protein [Candidatus Aenigmarchaeota archaeon]
MRVHIYVAIAIVLALAAHAEAQQATREQALNAIAEARITINDMQAAGFGTVLAGDLLSQAEETINATDIADYDQILEKTALIQEMAGNAFLLSDSLKAINISMEELAASRLNTTKAADLYYQASEAFREERYAEAEELIDEAFQAVNEAQAEYSRLNILLSNTQQGLASFIQGNLREVAISTAATALIIVVSGIRLQRHFRRSRVKKLELEHQVLINLIKKAQLDRFEKGSITNREYEIKMEKFKEILAEVEKNLSVLKSGKRPGQDRPPRTPAADVKPQKPPPVFDTSPKTAKPADAAKAGQKVEPKPEAPRQQPNPPESPKPSRIPPKPPHPPAVEKRHQAQARHSAPSRPSGPPPTLPRPLPKAHATAKPPRPPAAPPSGKEKGQADRSGHGLDELENELSSLRNLIKLLKTDQKKGRVTKQEYSEKMADYKKRLANAEKSLAGLKEKRA